jgi:DNA-binding winged helix-turn-helix (wHTH) protein
MESRSTAEIVVSGPDAALPFTVPLGGARLTVGRLDANDVVLQPDPQRLVSRFAHCTLEREGSRWLLVDGGSLNGTYVRRGGGLQRVRERRPLHDGDVVCVLASVGKTGERRFFELAFQSSPADSQATRAAVLGGDDCLTYDTEQARLVLRRGGEVHDVPIRAQAHRLVRYMVARNAAAGGAPALCTHDELMQAVWADEPMHTREELAKLVWELRKKLEPFGAKHLIESERRLGYRLRSCRD